MGNAASRNVLRRSSLSAVKTGRPARNQNFGGSFRGVYFGPLPMKRRRRASDAAPHSAELIVVSSFAHCCSTWCSRSGCTTSESTVSVDVAFPHAANKHAANKSQDLFTKHLLQQAFDDIGFVKPCRPANPRIQA